MALPAGHRLAGIQFRGASLAVVMTAANSVPAVKLGDELSVSTIGFGAMALTPVYGDVDDAESLTTLHRTVDGMKERGLRSSCPFRARMLGVLTLFHDEGGPL